jgi:16S rRNA (uracil1498-N3)-methyltransferase
MHIFYIPYISGNSITLPEDESKHCIRVLRLSIGDDIHVIDGLGNLLTCRIADANPKRCTAISIKTQPEFGKRNFYLHIAIAPTKNIDRFEWFLEKATEIGIDEITPLLCEHSERKNVNIDRIERVVIAAMKQSIKAYKPKLNPITSFSKIITSSDENTKMIAYCGEFNSPHANNYIAKGNSLLFLIGPEGDFSQYEVDKAQQNGFISVGLGSSRLRTETAGIVACTTSNLINDI